MAESMKEKRKRRSLEDARKRIKIQCFCEIHASSQKLEKRASEAARLFSSPLDDEQVVFMEHMESAQSALASFLTANGHARLLRSVKEEKDRLQATWKLEACGGRHGKLGYVFKSELQFSCHLHVWSWYVALFVVLSHRRMEIALLRVLEQGKLRFRFPLYNCDNHAEDHIDWDGDQWQVVLCESPPFTRKMVSRSAIFFTDVRHYITNLTKSQVEDLLHNKASDDKCYTGLRDRARDLLSQLPYHVWWVSSAPHVRDKDGKHITIAIPGTKQVHLYIIHKDSKSKGAGVQYEKQQYILKDMVDARPLPLR